MTINSKNTKAEILAAYKELDRQKKSLESEIKKTIKASPIVGHTAPKNFTAVINKNNIQNITNTIQALEQIQTGFGAAVSNLSEHLITEATQLDTIKKEIAQEKLELEQLYELTEIEESTIDNLIEQYQENAKQYAEELSQQKESDCASIEALKQAWVKEKEAQARFIKTRNEDYRKSQQREKEEYEYNLDLARDLDEEEYEQEQKQKQQELATTRQTLEKQWQEKEAEITRQEQEYAAAKKEVSAFEEQLKAAIQQGKEQGKGIGIYQAKVKADLRGKEIEGETQNYQLRIESLSQTIEHQEGRINKLSQQLDASLQQVQNLAVKAIEGTSNRNSFEAMKAIAIEQAKTQQKGK